MRVSTLAQTYLTGTAPIAADRSLAPKAVWAPEPAPRDWAKFSGERQVSAQIEWGGFCSPAADYTSKVAPPWRKPGDTVPFELKVRVDGDTDGISAELVTNANHNDDANVFEAYEMRPVDHADGVVTFRADVPIHKLGAYTATARITTDGEHHEWANARGCTDIHFRPYDVRFDRLNVREISLSNLGKDGEPGTIEDLLEPNSAGGYPLEDLVEQGVTAALFVPMHENTEVHRRGPAGSPYAVKNPFSVAARHSREGQRIQKEIEALEASHPDHSAPDFKKQKAELERAAFAAGHASFDKLIAKCKDLGIEVFLDVAPNHAAWDAGVFDLFSRYDEAGAIAWEIRKNDPAQFETHKGQTEAMNAKIAQLEEAGVEQELRDVAPHLFAAWNDGNPRGAKNRDEIVRGGWWEWPDVMQDWHGVKRDGWKWYEMPQTAETRANRGWRRRALELFVMKGVSGFRVDHGTGLPLAFFDRDLNRVQSLVDMIRPGESLYAIPEDFHRKDDTRRRVDRLQGGWFHDLRAARTPADFRGVIDNRGNDDERTLGNHDESRGASAFGGDWRAYAQHQTRLMFAGGPYSSLMGDELGEQRQLDFKSYETVPTLLHANDAAQEVKSIIGRAGRLKRDLPALHTRNTHWLPTKDAGWDNRILAAARLPIDETDNLVLWFDNFDPHNRVSNVFMLSDEAKARLDDDVAYRAVDHFAEGAPDLWEKPMTGAEIKQNGVYAELDRYGTQLIELVPA